jgi:hypothetical protein
MPREYTFFFRHNEYSIWEQLDRIPAQEFYDAMAKILLGQGYTSLPECYGTDKRASMHFLMHNCERDVLQRGIAPCFEEYGKKGDILNCLIIAHSIFTVRPNADMCINGNLRDHHYELVKRQLSAEHLTISGFIHGNNHVDVRLTLKSTYYERYEEGHEEQVEAREYDQNIEIRCYPKLGLGFVTRHYKSQEKLVHYVNLVIQALSGQEENQVVTQPLTLQEEQLLIIQSGLRGEMRGGTLQLSNEPVRLTFDGRKTLEAKSSVLLNLAQRSGKYQSIEFLFYDHATSDRHRMRILGSEASVVTTGEVQPSVVDDLVQHLVVAREMQDFMKDPDRTLYHLVERQVHAAPEAMKNRLTRDLMQEFEQILSSCVTLTTRDPLWPAIRSAAFNILADITIQGVKVGSVSQDYTLTYKSVTQLIQLFGVANSPIKTAQINAIIEKFTSLINGCDNPFVLMKRYVDDKGARTLVDPLVSTSS